MSPSTAPTAGERMRHRRRLRAAVSLFEVLAAPHGIDRYLELVNPALSVHELRARVTGVEHLTPDTVTLTLAPNHRWAGFVAGQFVQLTVEIDGIRRTRCYSPCGSQHQANGTIDLTVKAHPDGTVSRYLTNQARPGLVVGLSPAEGAFRLPDQRPDSVLLISGGSGITPVLSMLRTLCDELDRGSYQGRISFLHYAAGPADVPYLDELRSLQARHRQVEVIFGYQQADAGDGADADADAGGGEVAGRFARAHLDAAAPWWAEAETYLCGPASLTAAVRQLYADHGRTVQLHSEDFSPPVIADTDPAVGTVSFAASGIIVANSGRNLLDQAEAAGLSPPYGCRMGICFTCTRTRVSGGTRNLLTGERSEEDNSDIQLCISVPAGDVAVDL